VAEVEGAAQAGFALVLLDDPGFDRARLADDRHQRLGVALEQRLQRAGDTREQIRARDHAVLDDLVEAGAELATRQRAEERGIDHDQRGRMERADQVLPCAWLTPTLPPIALSTWASSVVGTWTTGTPRRNVAAANPATSPTTPPPTAMMVLARSARARISAS
jgi:hypothetical protein